MTDKTINYSYLMYNPSDVAMADMAKFMQDRNVFNLNFTFRIKLNPFEVFSRVMKKLPEGSSYSFTSASRFHAVSDDIVVKVAFDTFGPKDDLAGMYWVDLIGEDYKDLERIQKELEEEFLSYSINSVVWALLDGRGNVVYKEMSIRSDHKVHDCFYPWLGCSIDDYLTSFLRSEESILLLTGIPGTGKTTFIKNMLVKKGLNAVITYDERLIKDDSFFLDFLDRDKDVLIIEDADSFIYDRETTQNTIMSKILNVSDGLIKNISKKIIFSTNITEIDKIDPALMRPGRCYDVLDFRKLTHDEATEVVKTAGINKELDHRDYTLAELFSSNGRDQRGGASSRTVGFGFVGAA